MEGGGYGKVEMSLGGGRVGFGMVVNYEEGRSERIVWGKEWK